MLRMTERETQAQAMSSASFTHAETAVINYFMSSRVGKHRIQSNKIDW